MHKRGCLGNNPRMLFVSKGRAAAVSIELPGHCTCARSAVKALTPMCCLLELNTVKSLMVPPGGTILFAIQKIAE